MKGGGHTHEGCRRDGIEIKVAGKGRTEGREARSGKKRREERRRARA